MDVSWQSNKDLSSRVVFEGTHYIAIGEHVDLWELGRKMSDKKVRYYTLNFIIKMSGNNSVNRFMWKCYGTDHLAPRTFYKNPRRWVTTWNVCFKKTVYIFFTLFCFYFNSYLLLHSAWRITPGYGSIWGIQTFPNSMASHSILGTCPHSFCQSIAMSLS